MAAGFNLTTEATLWSDRSALDGLQARGLKALIWLGGWYNSNCTWEFSDAQIRSGLPAIAGHPAILGYTLGDEPLFSACPSGPAAFRQRTALVHSLDPGRPTFTVIQDWDEGNQEETPFGHWVGTVDILGLEVYPCSHGQPCDYSSIDKTVAAAARYGISRYYAVIQAFQDSYWRMPTPDEIKGQLDHWAGSRMSGYLVFSWNWAGTSLDSYPNQIAMLKYENQLHGAAN